ncbi:PIN domain-containing protein [Thioflavicoccus mobilis]|nr:PIN domain-containing protein [Thioflavicoccus mobilis]
MAKKKKDEMDALLFIDTNILLDFYRDRKSDISMKFLEQIEACKDRLILGSQVEMEYKKNRQHVILESLGKFGAPDWGKLSAPALVAETQAAGMIDKHRKELVKQQKIVTEKIQNILEKPATQDEVYKVLQRVFKYSSPYNLNREDKKRFAIRRLARKRFFLGYPPRKKNDTSYGDAINWEWLVQCSIDSGKDVVIVTRDSDYGVVYKSKSYINDWLLQEFKQRVSQKRNLKLTASLSEGLKIVHAKVTKEMEEEEKAMLLDFLSNLRTLDDIEPEQDEL